MVTSMVRVVMLSTNLRSWLMTMTAFALADQEIFQPLYGLDIQMVGRLVQNSTSGFCSNNLANSMRMRHPPLKSLVWRLKSSR